MGENRETKLLGVGCIQTAITFKHNDSVELILVPNDIEFPLVFKNSLVNKLPPYKEDVVFSPPNRPAVRNQLGLFQRHSRKFLNT